MLYRFVKLVARLALPFYCRKVRINKPELLAIDGPVLLAVNHPNSFLDAILLCTLFDKPLHSLTRGDAFRNKHVANILWKLHLLPVYRVSEGAENLTANYASFARCAAIFKRRGLVLIFSEGRCVNEWHLRPLKKGTARLAIDSWRQGIPLHILPVGINYSSFRRFGKNVHIFIGDVITREEVNLQDTHGNLVRTFNQLLRERLQPLVYEIFADDRNSAEKRFFTPIPAGKRVALFLPSMLGRLLHLPLYVAVRTFVNAKTRSKDHYDSAIVGVLFFAYPLYLLAIAAISYPMWGAYALSAWIIFPFTAWAHLQLKTPV